MSFRAAWASLTILSLPLSVALADESFKGFTPLSTLEPGKPGRGAFELVARYHVLSVDEAAFVGGGDSFANPLTSARKARAAGTRIGLAF